MAGLPFIPQLQTVPRNAWLYFAPMAASRLWRQPVGRTPQQISPELFFNTQVPIGADFSGQYIPSEAIPIPDQSPDPLTVLSPEAAQQVDYEDYLKSMEQILKDNPNVRTVEKRKEAEEITKETLRELERERMEEAARNYETTLTRSEQIKNVAEKAVPGAALGAGTGYLLGGIPGALTGAGLGGAATAYLLNNTGNVNPVLTGVGIGGLAGAGLGYLADGTTSAIAGGLTGAGVGGLIAPQLVRRWQRQYPIA